MPMLSGSHNPIAALLQYYLASYMLEVLINMVKVFLYMVQFSIYMIYVLLVTDKALNTLYKSS
jgi:hypothetical protein